MPGKEDIRSLASEMSKMYEEVHSKDLTLDRLVSAVSKAGDLYRKFEKKYADAPFEVFEVQLVDEKVVEKPFDLR